MDEPLNAVDASTRAALHNVFQDLHRQGKTVVVATHDLGRLASEFDAAVYLSDGRQVPPPEGAFAGTKVSGPFSSQVDPALMFTAVRAGKGS